MYTPNVPKNGEIADDGSNLSTHIRDLDLYFSKKGFTFIENW